MKIAFVGKGGSGKTTATWLFFEHLRNSGNRVLGIDGDHNMDFASLLNVPVASGTATFHRQHAHFRSSVGLDTDKNWARVIMDGRTLPSFSIYPLDPFSETVYQSLGENAGIMVTGLGGDDVLWSERCAHGHSAPLKYYLPLFTDSSCHVVIDGVAGVDMLNFGLYHGADLLLGVVESHKNSLRVMEQIAAIADKTEMPIRFVINKPSDTDFMRAFSEAHKDRIVGVIPHDPGVAAYDFGKLARETRRSLSDIWNQLESISPAIPGIERLRTFEKNKRAHQSAS